MRSQTVSQQLAKYARFSLVNSIALLGDAVRLYKSGRWGTAFYLATISMEEFAKCCIANDALYNRQINEHPIAETVRWLRLAMSHKLKHYKFAREGTRLAPVDFLRQVIDETLDRTKQSALYTDIELVDQRRLLTVSTPDTAIREAAARRQISIVHDALIDLIKGVLDGNYLLEIGDQLPPLDRETLRKLRRLWVAGYKFQRSSLTKYERMKTD